MQQFETVDAYIIDKTEYQAGLEHLRAILLDSGLEEAVKWGAPAYVYNKKNLIGLFAFKNYFGLWFHQGVFLKDPQKVLINAQEGVTKALRQWRFTSLEEVDESVVRAYIKEAIQNCIDGKEMKPEKKELVIPELLQNALDADDILKQAFENFTLSKKREFTEHISSAKREPTKLSRLEKIKPMILNGVGLNDKYR